MKTTGDKRLMEYSDGTSSFALWWKSVFLIPIWGVLPAALLGSLMWRLGFVFVEMGYVLVLLVGMVYFVEDLLKRKIKIQDGKLFLGFRKYFLSKLHSLKVIYDSKRIIPQYLVFSFQDGKQFHLYLARLLASDIQYIVSLIDTRYPHCRVDPVLRHLARCHDLAPVLKEADDGPITISYQSNRIIEEMKDSFLSMFGSWSRLGPSIALLLFAPMWSVFTFGAFSIFKLIPGSEGQSLVAETLQNLFTHLNNVIGEVVGSALTQAGTAATTPVAGCIAAIISIFLIARIIGNLIKPNQLHLDPANLSFQKSVFLWTTTMERIPWAKVVHAQLLKPENDKDLEGWKISLRATENQELKRLDLAALDQHSRRDFLKRLKIYAPQCNLEPDLEEALLPSQRKSYTELWLQSLATSPERKNLEPLSPGQKLQDGRYEAVCRLGVGGQGAAYLAREQTLLDADHCPEVVLKETILPVFVDDAIRKQSLQRFEHEAKMLESLDHPHIVKMLDFFVEDHRGYLVLEHIEGSNLRVITERERLSPEQIKELIEKMCRLLAYLHDREVLHRDFTPDNLILTKNGDLKLIDFNVAQVVKSGMTGTVVGKHAYLPPEQFRGKPTVQSDIYAMGCTIYFLLTGVDPEPLSQSSLKHDRPEVDIIFDTIIKSCTATKADHRFKSVNEILVFLEEPEEASVEENLTINLSSKKELNST